MNSANRDLERDPELANLYRASATEQPPEVLDAMICAAARGASISTLPSRRARASRWHAPVALAAAVVLSVSLVMVMDDEGSRWLARSPQRVAGESTEAPAREALALAQPEAPSVPESRGLGLKPPQPLQRGLGLRNDGIAGGGEPGQGKPRARDEDVSANSRGSADAPSPRPKSASRDSVVAEQQAPSGQRSFSSGPAPFEPPPLLSARPESPSDAPASRAAPAEKATLGGIRAPPLRAREESAPEKTAPSAANAPRVVVESAAPRQAPNPAAPPTSQKSEAGPPSASLPEPSVEKWLERIVTLRAQGKIDEANRELGEFRKRHPHYRLPPELSPPDR